METFIRNCQVKDIAISCFALSRFFLCEKYIIIKHPFIIERWVLAVFNNLFDSDTSKNNIFTLFGHVVRL